MIEAKEADGKNAGPNNTVQSPAVSLLCTAESDAGIKIAFHVVHIPFPFPSSPPSPLSSGFFIRYSHAPSKPLPRSLALSLHFSPSFPQHTAHQSQRPQHHHQPLQRPLLLTFPPLHISPAVSRE